LDGSGREESAAKLSIELPARPRSSEPRLARIAPSESPLAGQLQNMGLPPQDVNERRELTANEKAPRQAAAAAESVASTVSEPAVGQASKGPSAWVVQVGSFAEPNNALQLRDELRSAGFAAFTEKVSAAKGTFFRVRVGPDRRKDRARALAQRLEAEQGRKGDLVRYP
jgi:cell division septation protein DedD